MSLRYTKPAALAGIYTPLSKYNCEIDVIGVSIQSLPAMLIMIEIPTNTRDNPGYIKNVERLFNDRISKWTLKDLYITHIDNWFDEKWVKFSGTIMHEISIHNLVDITVPPFHPTV